MCARVCMHLRTHFLCCSKFTVTVPSVFIIMLLTDGEWVFVVTWMCSDIASISMYRDLLAWTSICPFFPLFWLATCHASHIHYSIHLMPPNHFSIPFMSYCVLGHVQIPLLWSDFFTECNPVLPLSISRILSFPEGHPVAAYVFFLIFPSLMSFFLDLLVFIVFKHLPGYNCVIPEYGGSGFLWNFMSTSEPTMCQNLEDSPLFSVISNFLYVF